MISFIDIIQSISAASAASAASATSVTGPQAAPARSKRVVVVLDTSGSTGCGFDGRLTVLQKERQVLVNYILENQADYILYTFDTQSNYMGKIPVLYQEKMVTLPEMRSSGGTTTHLPLAEILKKFPVFKPDEVIIITDGETASASHQFAPIIQQFKVAGVILKVIGVSTKSDNLEIISAREEQNVTGMDLIRMLGNDIYSFQIYNRHHSAIPFCGATSSTVNRNALQFMGVNISGIIPQFILKVLAEIVPKKDTIDWGESQSVLKNMICEIGKLLSVMFVTFPESHSFIHDVIQQISQINVEFTPERILNIMIYGFTCARNNTPIVMTNFEGRVKEAQVKKSEFADAVAKLNTQGTTLGETRRICMPTNGVCIIDQSALQLQSPLGPYPKSKDKFGNSYFGMNSNPQAIRIALRELCTTLGFPNAKNSPSVVFYVSTQMALMMINGIPTDCEHFLELRKLARMQVSMEGMVAQGKYDGIGFFCQWQAGQLPLMTYQNPKTHTSLYTDSNINPLGLNEPLWWALQMSMLGIFNEQLHVYQEALKLVCPDGPTEQNFMKYIREEYSSKVNGTVILQKYSPMKSSVISLDAFQPTDRIVLFKNHLSSSGQACTTETWYSENEMDNYIKQHGCVWCRHVPLPSEIEPITVENPEVKLTEAMASGRPLTVSGIVASAVSSMIPSTPIAQRAPRAAAISIGAGPSVHRISMQGITGCGKSTFSQKIHDHIIASGKKALIVSADKHSKDGVNGKQLQYVIQNEINRFLRESGEKVIIFDVCNEQGVQSKAFNVDMSRFVSNTFIPNFESSTDDFSDYEAWCLNNVLSRPLHTASTNYWLNPVSAGVGTCIKVHNMKARGIKQQFGIPGSPCGFSESNNMEQIKAIIAPGAARHAAKLAARDSQQDFMQFLTSIGL